MPYVDFTPLIHELIVRDLSIAAFMNELLIAHENAHPQYDWAPLKALDFDESESLLERWLVPAFGREPPRAKRIKAIWCGLFHPIRGEETVADMYVAGTKDFELDQVPRKWNLRPAYWPLLRHANSRVLANLYRCAYGDSGPGNDAENYLGLGYAAKTILTLLGRVDAEPILGSGKKVQVAVGWDSGEPLYIGHLGRAGFVPRPVAEAKAGLHLQSTRSEEYGRRQEQERQDSVRHFRHPDGRVWSIVVTDGSIELRFTDTDGEEHDRTRFRKGVVEDMAAIAETLVKEQALEGFVEVPPRDAKGP